MRSPVSRRPLGEYNGIKSCGFDESELTCVLNVKTAFRRFPQAPFLDTFTVSDTLLRCTP
jgi:hypothetical protein